MKIYNVKNHTLNGEMFRKLNEFSTDLYGGVLGKTTEAPVFSYSSNKVVIKPSLLINGVLPILCGGSVVTLTADDFTYPLTNHRYFLQVLTNFDNDTIDTSSTVSIIKENLSASIEDYIETNQSIAISGGYKVPLFEYNNGTLTSVVAVKDKSSLEEWLSTNAIEQLWDELHSTFTHQVGTTTDAEPGTPEYYYGKLGKYIFLEDGRILNSDTGEVLITLDITRNKLKFNQLSTGAVLSNSGQIFTGVVPIQYGGTDASNRGQAKTNLGIFYGTADPNTTAPTQTPEVGDIYYKILT